MTTKLTKLLALALAFVMVLGLFAACAKTETPAQTPAETPETPAETPAETPEAPAETPQTPAEEEKEPVTIRFWQAGGDTVGASTIMRLLLDQFENEYPWITVDYQAIPWSNDPETMFSTGIASGDIADVLVVGDSRAFIFASEGNIMPLDDMLTEETKDDLIDVLKVDSVYNSNLNPDMTGKTIYVPLYGGTRTILYNKEIFDYFGVDYPTESMTHAELLEMAKQLTGDMNGTHVYGYAVFGNAYGGSSKYGYLYVDSTLKTKLTASNDTAKFKYNYKSSDSRYYYDLDDVTYAAGSATGKYTVTIPFTAYGTGYTGTSFKAVAKEITDAYKNAMYVMEMSIPCGICIFSITHRCVNSINEDYCSIRPYRLKKSRNPIFWETTSDTIV